MEYDLIRIQEVDREQLRDRVYFECVLNFFHPEPESQVPDRDALFKSFLQGLPCTENQLKIRDRFHAIAEERGARATNFRWWDIVSPSERYLLADIIRDGLTIRVGFAWKTTVKGSSPPGSAASLSWGPDKNAPGGRFLVIEGHTYQEVKEAFRSWLATSSSPTPSP